MKKMTKWLAVCAVCVMGSVPAMAAEVPDVTVTPIPIETPAPDVTPIETPAPTPIPEVKNGWCEYGTKNKKYFKDHSNFYLYDDIENAKLHPAILHYVPSFTTRPWVSNCKHPKKNLYWNIISKTPWIDAKPEKDKSKWYVKLINFRYRKLYW